MSTGRSVLSIEVVFIVFGAFLVVFGGLGLLRRNDFLEDVNKATREFIKWPTFSDEFVSDYSRFMSGVVFALGLAFMASPWIH